MKNLELMNINKGSSRTNNQKKTLSIFPVPGEICRQVSLPKILHQFIDHIGT
jgi:hypothetical protein